MSDKVYNVLFVDVGNAARSILAEVVANTEGKGRLRAFSAGCRPHGQVSPHALEMARQIDYPLAGLRSKDWSEFAGDGAPEMDLIILLNDVEHDICCPVWPGQPATARWTFSDPDVASDDRSRAEAYHHLFRELAERINLLLDLPEQSLDRMALELHAGKLHAAQLHVVGPS